MIHMHDLQVQNQIVSKNSIEATNKIEAKDLKINGVATIGTLSAGTVNIGNTLQANSISVTSPIPNQPTLAIHSNSLKCDDNTIDLSKLTVNDKSIAVIPDAPLTSKDAAPVPFLANNKLNYIDDLYVQTYAGKTAIFTPDIYVTAGGENKKYLTQQTIKIAGNDVKIWGGSLAADTLATSLSDSDNLIPKNAISANSLSLSSDVGSTSCPIYFDSNGLPQECTSVQAATAQSAIQANLALKAQTLDVTSTNGVGDFSQPVYFDVDGKPQPCSSVVATKLLDDVNVGAEDTPIYFKGGIPMACTQLYAAEAGRADEADVAMSADIALSLRLPDNPEDPPETSTKGQVFFKIDHNNSHTIQQENGIWYPLIPYIFIPNN